MLAQDTILHVYGDFDKEIITFKFYTGNQDPSKTKSIKLKRHGFFISLNVNDTRPLLHQDKDTLIVVLATVWVESSSVPAAVLKFTRKKNEWSELPQQEFVKSQTNSPTVAWSSSILPSKHILILL